MFAAKLGIHNTIKKLTTFGRSRWVKPSDVDQVLRTKTSFRIGQSSVHRTADGFVVGGRESTRYLNRTVSHHEMMHIGQYIRNPGINDTRSLIGFVHEAIPAYIGTPELYIGGTAAIVGGAVLLGKWVYGSL